ncbi:MAG: hypothetical protein HY072_10395, partial [Deltaproteobacteria bacterium]|nr:hypothetical protein [Deltaproteobacteria bacterium]
MWKRPILLFLLLTLFFVVGAVLFIQSVYFSKFIKQVAMKYVPQELGMQFDFDNLSIELFPPGISFVKPKLSLKKENALQLPENATISAEKVVLSFLPLQMVSGNIRIHKVIIERGNLQFPFEVGFFSKKKTKKSRPFKFTWEELVQIRADSVHLKDSELKFVFNEVGLDLNFFAHSVVLQKRKGDAGDGYQALIDLQNIRGILPQKSKIPFHLEKLNANLTLNSYGFLLESLQAAEKSIQLEAKGQIRGDLFSSKDWLADIKINTLGQLSDFFTVINYQKNQVLLGKAKFDGQFKGNLLHIMDSLRLEGVLQVVGASYQKWSADELKLNGSWSLFPHGNELHILKGQIESKELKREGESQAGWGGKIELGEFRVNLAETTEIPLPLKLKRADLHWLVGSDFKSIYPFNFRASGPVHLIYKTNKKENEAWTLQSKIKLKLDEFQLDNQDYGKKKLLKRILNIQDVILVGDIQINSQGIQVKDLSLDLPKTHFQLGGGFNFTSGFDLTAVGNVHLQDVKHIAEIEIFGDGKLKTHVIGPLSGVAIHFEHELTDARYLNLNFGNINGKIIYDIGKSELKISQVEATKGATVYSVDGRVDFKADKVDIKTKIQKGTVQDLVVVFEDLTKLVSWFPKKLIGKLKGSADIYGGLDLSQLEVLSQIEGEQWEYAGEKFKTVFLTGGFDKGTYYIKRVQAIKHHSLISGSISIDSEKYLKWGFNSSSIDLNEWDHIARLDIPLRGRVELFTFGEGVLGLVQSTTKFSFPEIYLRGSKLPPCFFELSHFGNAIHILARLFENQGQLEVNYNTREGVYSSLKGTLREFDFTPFLFFLNPKLIQDSSLVSTVSGRLDINFKTSEWEKIRGKIELFEYNLKKTDFYLKLKEPVSVKIENGSFSQADISLVGKESKAVLSLKATDGVLEGSLLGSCDLMLLEFFTPLAVQTKGQALFDLILSGALTNPQFFGKIEFSQAGFKIPALDSPLENITGQVQFKQNKILFKEVQADLAQGRVGLDGEIQLFLNKFPELSLVVVLQGSRLKIYPFQYVKTQGKIQITGT